MSTQSDLLDETVKTPSEVKPTRIVNDTSIFYKGLFGMILCIVPAAIIGLILIKLSLDQAKEARIAYNKQPERYLESSYAKVKQGRIMAYIGLTLFIVEIITLVGYMSIN